MALKQLSKDYDDRIAKLSNKIKKKIEEREKIKEKINLFKDKFKDTSLEGDDKNAVEEDLQPDKIANMLENKEEENQELRVKT